MDIKTKERTPLYTGSSDCCFLPHWSPDGKKILFAHCSGVPPNHAMGIYIMNADGSNPIRLTDTPPGNCYWGFCWSPDCMKIAFSHDWSIDSTTITGGIFVMDLDSKEVTQLNKPDTNVFYSDPDWQPVHNVKHRAEFFDGHGFHSNVLMLLKPDGGIYKWTTMTDSTASFSTSYMPNIEGTQAISAVG